MSKVRRLAALLLCVLLLSCIGVGAYAHDVPDLTRQGSINISMRCGNFAVPGGTLSLYRVGDIQEDDGNYSFVPSAGFTGCTDAFDDIQSPALAQKLADYAKENKIPSRTQKIDQRGKITFSVEPGLYLLVQEKAAEGYLAVAPFLVSVPMNEDGSYIYDVDASPKAEPEEAPLPTPTPTPKPPALAQTGQLNWPVPVLALLGLCLFSLGWLLRFGKKNSDEK